MNEIGITEWVDPAYTAITANLSLLNNGADDKYAIVIHLTDITGRYGSYLVAASLPLGAEKKVDLSSLNIAIADFYVSWEDSCARIRRYTQNAVSNSARGFKMTSVWWMSPGGKVEEQFVDGQS